MTLKKVIWFFIFIGLGLGLGLIYGWSISPAGAQGAGLPSLREDFKADYAVMTAEIFQHDHNALLALSRLNRLGASSALQALEDSLMAAQKYGFSLSDLQLIAQMYQSLQSSPGSSPGGLP